MSDPLEPIHFTIDGSPEFGDRVTVVKFLTAVDEWLRSLRQTVTDIAPRRRAVEWLLAEVRPGSAEVEIEPFPLTPDGPAIAQQAVRANVVALNTIRQGGDPTKVVSKKAARPLLQLVKRVEDQQLPGIHVRSGELHAEIVPLRADDDRHRRSFFRALGSLDGEIVSVSFAATPASFTVRERLDGVLVPCYFDPDLLYDDVVSNLRRRVSVIGLLTRRANGVASFMTDVESVDRVPVRDDLPQPADLLGIDPDFTGGLPAEIYVRSRRD